MIRPMLQVEGKWFATCCLVNKVLHSGVRTFEPINPGFVFPPLAAEWIHMGLFRALKWGVKVRMAD